MGNGYAITAVVGTKKLWNALKTFISSTFWTERIGPCCCFEDLRSDEKG